MHHPLDFIVFGIPRSGTKALVRALNLHPNVYCAMERFHFRADHSRLTFPELFVDTKGLGNWDDPAKIRRIQQELAQKDDVRTVGNKLPRYYFALDRINREIPNARNIWIYRSPFGFVPSWNVREQTRGKGQWPTGQIGLFGMLELLVCIENSLALFKDVLVFPYRHGLGNSTESLLRTIDFLDADPSSTTARALQICRLGAKRNGDAASATPPGLVICCKTTRRSSSPLCAFALWTT